MKEDFNKNLKVLAQEIDVNLNEEQIKSFYEYMNLLLEWNEKINLTAITEQNEVILKHFIDSMTVLKDLKDNQNIIDVGTGAGFPGIPIAIVKKNCKITLMDSLNKRIKFLDEVINKLELKNVNAIHSRAEDMGQNTLYREKFDIAISRAVANLTVLSEYLLPFVKVGGMCICMKGPDIADEIKNSDFAINELGGKIVSVDDFELPNSDIKRNIVIIEKVKNTPKKYPRKAGIPSKLPLA